MFSKGFVCRKRLRVSKEQSFLTSLNQTRHIREHGFRILSELAVWSSDLPYSARRGVFRNIGSFLEWSLRTGLKGSNNATSHSGPSHFQVVLLPCVCVCGEGVMGAKPTSPCSLELHRADPVPLESPLKHFHMPRVSSPHRPNVSGLSQVLLPGRNWAFLVVSPGPGTVNARQIVACYING